MSGLMVYVEVSEKYNWALLPFSYLFNIFWGELQEVIIIGFTPPSFRLPSNFYFYSVAPSNWPPEKWSDAMIQFFSEQPEEHFVFLLCDYWLSRLVDVRGVAACYDYIRNRPEVLRIDLTTDRLYAGGMFDVEAWGCYDVIETPHGTPYQMSIQAAIWNRKLFLSLLQPGKSPWEVETHIQPPETMRVLGTRQCPIRYANAILKGKLDFPQIRTLPSPHKERVFDMIPSEYLQEQS